MSVCTAGPPPPLDRSTLPPPGAVFRAAPVVCDGCGERFYVAQDEAGSFMQGLRTLADWGHHPVADEQVP